MSKPVRIASRPASALVAEMKVFAQVPLAAREKGV
jgi:hypothetical protein